MHVINRSRRLRSPSARARMSIAPLRSPDPVRGRPPRSQGETRSRSGPDRTALHVGHPHTAADPHRFRSGTEDTVLLTGRSRKRWSPIRPRPHRSQTWEGVLMPFPSSLNSNFLPEPLSKRLHSAKIARALWLVRFSGLTQEVEHVVSRLEIFDQYIRLPVSPHANLRHIYFRCFMRSEQDIIVSRILRIVKFFRCQAPSQVIAPPRCHVQCSKDFFVLNIASGYRQQLCAEPEFSKFSGRRI